MPLLIALLALSQRVVETAPPARLDPRVFAGRAAGERASFLVVLREQADLSGAEAIADRPARRRFVWEALRARAEVSQAPLRRRLERLGVGYRVHTLVNMLEVEGDEATARALAGEPAVLAVAANRGGGWRPPVSRRREVLAPAPADDAEPNVVRIGAPQLWAAGYTGEGVVVGVADTGIRWFHPALRDRYRGWDGAAASHAYNWHDAVHDARTANACGSDSPEPCDDQGHGTAVAGLAVGDGGEGNRIGVAPGARLIGCRNMDIGAGTPARYVECFEFFLAPTNLAGEDPRPELGADVVNNSWTCQDAEGCTDPSVLESAVLALRAAGIAQTFAAGNGGAACATVSSPPATYEAAFTVGATDLSDQIAGFSSRGPVLRDGSGRIKPDLVAPGVNVRSCSLDAGSDPYGLFGGTSAASPHVAGAIALLWQAMPGLRGDVEQTEAILEASAVRLTSASGCAGIGGGAIPNTTFGWGRLDVAAAAGFRFPPVPPAGFRPPPRVLPPR